MAQKQKEALSDYIAIKATPTMKKKLKDLADKDNREFSDFIRLQWKKLIEKNSRS